MFTPNGITTCVGPVAFGPSPLFPSARLIDSPARGMGSLWGFDERLCTRCAPHSNSTPAMVGVCARRRAAGRDVVFSLEPDSPFDLLALEDGLAQQGIVIA